MQTTGNILVNGEKILVLVRQKKYSRSLKMRISGKDGNTFTDEGIFLSEHPDLVKQLKEGKVITL